MSDLCSFMGRDRDGTTGRSPAIPDPRSHYISKSWLPRIHYKMVAVWDGLGTETVNKLSQVSILLPLK
ncbi:MAG: hypothetical protein GDA56_31975 [Hormoscilla sp. GM7CHS1pb]|nr:hypothetical protein [Hormoscilla sp. GM7CHS1pb]